MASPTVIGSNTTAQDNTNSTGITFSHTVPTTGQNRMLIVLYVADSVAASGVTYNGVSMTSIFSAPADSRYYSRAFYLANPATGANNVVVSWALTTGPKMITAITIQDAKQTSPIDQEASSGTVSVTSRTTTFTTANDNVLGFHNSRVGLNATGLTENASVTRQSNFQDANNRWMDTGTKVWTTAGSNDIGLSWTTATDVEQGAFGIQYKAPAATKATTLPLMGIGG